MAFFLFSAKLRNGLFCLGVAACFFLVAMALQHVLLLLHHDDVVLFFFLVFFLIAVALVVAASLFFWLSQWCSLVCCCCGLVLFLFAAASQHGFCCRNVMALVFVDAALLHWFLLPQHHGMFLFGCCGIAAFVAAVLFYFLLVLAAWSFFVDAASQHGPFLLPWRGSFLLLWHAGVCFCCRGITAWFVFDAAVLRRMLSWHSSF